jgi:hypothetical protein
MSPARGADGQSIPAPNGANVSTLVLEAVMSDSAASSRPRAGRRALVLAVPVLILPLAAALPAAAKGGHPGVRSAGACSGPSHWKLSAKADDGRIEVEAEVDNNVNGRTWNWQLSDSGAQVAAGKSATHAPSGSFTVNRRIPNRAGADVITFKARSVRTGETCSGTVRLG